MVSRLAAAETVWELEPIQVRPFWSMAEPAVTFATASSGWEYHPQIDLQTRGFAESQSDVTLRGGVFDNTGLQLGNLPLYDPQTGHYLAELPFDPGMLSPATILFGTEHGLAGLNSTAGSIRLQWLPIDDRRLVQAGIGDRQTRQGRLLWSEKFAGESEHWGVAVGIAGSESEGTRAYADHRFYRLNGLLQLRTANRRHDLALGYASKEYGVPGAYTGNPNFKEYDDYQVLLLTTHHVWTYDRDSEVHWEAGYRRLQDDYELNIVRGKDWFRAYRHETDLLAAALSGHHRWDQLGIIYQVSLAADHLDSTDLIYGPYRHRTLWKAGLLPEYRVDLSSRWQLGARAGVTYEGDNRTSQVWSPLLRLETIRRQEYGKINFFLDLAGNSQVAGYTALNSPPPPGAFAGNPRLERSTARNWQAGFLWEGGNWAWQSTVFFRQDDRLVDWTYSSTSGSLRQANPLDMETWGVETVLRMECEQLRWQVGFTWLDKHADYRSAAVDASFYALNYARYRLTAGLAWTPWKWLEVRADQELRKQEPNPRRTGDGFSYRASAGLFWHPESLAGWELGLLVDNVTDDNFQEFPGTPSSRRQWLLRLEYAW